MQGRRHLFLQEESKKTAQQADSGSISASMYSFGRTVHKDLDLILKLLDGQNSQQWQYYWVPRSKGQPLVKINMCLREIQRKTILQEPR